MKLAGTAAVNCPVLTTVVERASVPQYRVVPAPKPAPFAVNVNAGPPATAEVGERLVRIGVMPNAIGVGDVSPGADTLTDAVPAVVSRLDGTAAVNWLADTKVVVSDAPFHVTTVAVLKPDPVTVNAKPGDPAVVPVGEMPLRTSGGGLMVKVNGDGCGCVLIVTAAVPAAVNSDAGTIAVSCPELTYVVCSAAPFQVTLMEDRSEGEGAGKLAPFTVIVKLGLPTNAELGDRLLECRGRNRYRKICVALSVVIEINFRGFHRGQQVRGDGRHDLGRSGCAYNVQHLQLVKRRYIPVDLRCQAYRNSDS